jgi:hypothetical protein
MLLRKRREKGNVWKGLAAGVAGGLAASFVMSQFQSLLKKLSKGDEGAQSSQSAKKSGQAQGKQQKESQGGEEKEPATVKAASAISENVFSHDLTKSEKKAAGPAVHYAMGTASGAIYGVSAEFAPEVTVGAGLPFGTAVWLVADEVLVPALGLSKPPTKTPISKHASALASHLVYGLTADLVRRGIRAAL